MASSVSYLSILALTVFLGTTCTRAISVEGNDGTNMALTLDERPKEAWPWERVKFKCPSLNGVFANTEDCSSFFVCVMGRSSKKNCPPFTKFDKYQKKCLASIIAICDKGDKVTTTSPGTTKSKETTINDRTTTARDIFLCPSLLGTFIHPTECNKYYTCSFFIPILKTCSEDELFDGVKLKCRKARQVDCGSRSKPTDATVLTTLPTTPKPETTTTLDPETTTTQNRDIATSFPETTTPEPTTTSTPEPTTPEKPTGPPETSCDENDLDCIIDDTGVTPEWFTCPEDIGSYPHPSSKKLFIFCLNWEPSVKKCGQDMVYSTELRTCVDP